MMSRLSSAPSLALLLIAAFLTVQVQGRAFFGSFFQDFQDAQLNNGTTTALGGFGSLLEALAAFHQSHSLSDLSGLFLGK